MRLLELQRDEHKEQPQIKIVQGKYSTDAPHVKCPEVVGRITVIQKYPSYQEPRQHKEQVHPTPGKTYSLLEVGQRTASVRMYLILNIMPDKHQKDGAPSNPIKCGQSAPRLHLIASCIYQRHHIIGLSRSDP